MTGLHHSHLDEIDNHVVVQDVPLDIYPERRAHGRVDEYLQGFGIGYWSRDWEILLLLGRRWRWWRVLMYLLMVRTLLMLLLVLLLVLLLDALVVVVLSASG